MICTIFYAANTFDPEVLFFLAAYVGWIFLRGGGTGVRVTARSSISTSDGFLCVCVDSVAHFGASVFSLTPPMRIVRRPSWRLDK